jgi:hypothetical protein
MLHISTPFLIDFLAFGACKWAALAGEALTCQSGSESPHRGHGYRTVVSLKVEILIWKRETNLQP